MQASQEGGRKVRYAVVGAGWISQAAFLPAVAHTGNAKVTALVTGDAQKARVLGERYGIAHTYGYEQYADMLQSGQVDAVYLALPNWMHRDYAVPALQAGLHVLLEKPMATSVADCEAIQRAAAGSGARLMIAYRLHFEPATLDTLRRVRAGEIGRPRAFSAMFAQPVAPSNHRAQNGFWAGPVADMGPYPLNAARQLFGAEPVEVAALGSRDPALGFDFDDTVAVTLRFDDTRIAQFTVSYGGASCEHYRLVGDKGDILAQPAFGFGPGVALQTRITVDGKTETRDYPETDQFGGELQYFSACILAGREPEPSGQEGLADVRVLAAIEQALRSGAPVRLEPFARNAYADASQSTQLPPIEPPEAVNAASPMEA